MTALLFKMLSFALLAVLTLLPALYASAVVHKRQTTHEKLRAAKGKFPGIGWTYAFQDCTADVFDILFEVTRVTNEFINNAKMHGAGFDMYFIKNGGVFRDWRVR